MSKKLLTDIDVLSGAIVVQANADPDNAKKLAECLAVMVHSYVQLKEVEIHEKFHLQQEKLPGEDILPN